MIDFVIMTIITPSNSAKQARIAAIRRFNRFHTRWVGALNEGILASEYSLPKARLLYELNQSDALAAADLSRMLDMDAGYLSRLVGTLESEGLVERATAPDNAKRLPIALTEKGRGVARMLDEASVKDVGTLLDSLPESGQEELASSMNRIVRILSDEAPAAPVILRPPRPGDLGQVIYRQAALYAEEYGWDWTYEGMISEIIGNFVKNFDPSGENCWIAECDGEIAGSVFVVRESEDTAKLRLLYVEPAMRGKGVGRHLVAETIRFARAAGYRRMILWTNDIQHAARRIYQQAGFHLASEERHRSFGHDLVGQYWSLDL